jgi:hypothetical protein
LFEVELVQVVQQVLVMVLIERCQSVEDEFDDGGSLVPPGLYIARLAVEGDAIQDEKILVIGVVY